MQGEDVYWSAFVGFAVQIVTFRMNDLQDRHLELLLPNAHAWESIPEGRLFVGVCDLLHMIFKHFTGIPTHMV